MLRTSALKIITELGITGGCNVQYALHPESFEYCVIEVNPRVSRSSALASKATATPSPRWRRRSPLGYTLDEIKNAVTKKTYASFEPMLDYVVVKMPRLPFDKFIKRQPSPGHPDEGHRRGNEYLCTNFEGAVMKAIRSLEQHVDCLLSYDYSGLTDSQLMEKLKDVDDRRIWVIAEALRRGISYEAIHDITKIDIWFIDKLMILVEMEKALKEAGRGLTPELLKEAKRIEFPDNVISRLTGISQEEIKGMRHENGIIAAYKMVDTCAAEFAAETPYYYSCFGSENEADGTSDRKKVLVLGSGPIRIGQGIEFDFCSVHSTWAFEKEGYETINYQQQSRDGQHRLRYCRQAVFRAADSGGCGEHRRYREAGRGRGSVRRPDCHQADGSPDDEDGSSDPRNGGRGCGRGRGPGAVRLRF